MDMVLVIKVQIKAIFFTFYHCCILLFAFNLCIVLVGVHYLNNCDFKTIFIASCLLKAHATLLAPEERMEKENYKSKNYRFRVDKKKTIAINYI